jgi:hypothetical protein
VLLILALISCVGKSPILEDPGFNYFLGIEVGQIVSYEGLRQPGWPAPEKSASGPTCSVKPPVDSALGTVEVSFFAKCTGERHPYSSHCSEIGECTDLYSVRIDSSKTAGDRADEVLAQLTSSWGKPVPDCGQDRITEEGRVCAMWDRSQGAGLKVSAILVGDEESWELSSWVDEREYRTAKLEGLFRDMEEAAWG